MTSSCDRTFSARVVCISRENGDEFDLVLELWIVTIVVAQRLQTSSSANGLFGLSSGNSLASLFLIQLCSQRLAQGGRCRCSGQNANLADLRDYSNRLRLPQPLASHRHQVLGIRGAFRNGVERDIRDVLQ